MKFQLIGTGAEPHRNRTFIQFNYAQFCMCHEALLAEHQHVSIMPFSKNYINLSYFFKNNLDVALQFVNVETPWYIISHRCLSVITPYIMVNFQ